MSTIPTLTKEMVRDRFGDAVYRAAARFRPFDPLSAKERIGSTLVAECGGVYQLEYDLRATFDEEGICDAFCTCPMGDDGYCQHVATLLLAWIADPAEFEEVEPCEGEAGGSAIGPPRDPDRVAFEQELLQERPRSEHAVARALDGPPSADPGTWRRRVAAAFWKHGYDEYGEKRIAEELAELRQEADRRVERQEYASAVGIYEAIAAAVLETEELFLLVETESLTALVQECVGGLGRCLAGAPRETATRAVIWQILLDLYERDLRRLVPRFGKGVRELAQQHATEAERATIAARLEADLWLDDGDESVSPAAFLLDLVGDVIDDQAYLWICTRSHHRFEIVERLLEMGEVAAAIREAEASGDEQLLEIADLFVRYCYPGIAERLLLDGSRKTEDARLLRWAKRYYEARGEARLVLDYTRRLFYRQPTTEGCRELCQLAIERGRWEAIRSELLDFLHRHQQCGLMWRMLELDGDILEAMLRIVDRFRVTAQRSRR